MLLLLFTYDSTLFLCASFPPSTSAPPGISLPSHQMTGRPSSSSSTSPGPHLPPRVEWVCSCRQGEDIQCNDKVQIWDKILKHFILKKPSTLERSSYMNNSLETAQAEPRSAVFYLDIFHHSETLTKDIWLFFIRLSILSMESSPWRKIESRQKLVNLNTKRNITNRQKWDINDICERCTFQCCLKLQQPVIISLSCQRLHPSRTGVSTWLPSSLQAIVVSRRVCVSVCVRIPTWYLKSVLVEFILLKEACLEKLLISSLGEKNKNHTHILRIYGKPACSQNRSV